MLKLVEIKKDYVLKEQEPVHALKGLSVNFRRNEFVAILGPSGCGKTTLLNIIGGLDRYTSGDLLINGTSTKDYKDRDWDTYRNHSIGFVFQSYNLIGHQNILRNVELALTIGGVSKAERKERALEALKKVGLEGLEKKKPNQLSGGQMQRVAIARALVNKPEIILADEPTGALDSETSIQVMDLLKEVASNCLVIMVTHNPDLADTYANRIIKMKDGELLSDSNPYSEKEETSEVEKHKKEVLAKQEVNPKTNKVKKEKKSAMSFFTATGLSLSNLVSKLQRTILIAIAGSIGIIGVSSVLSVSFGVKNYVNRMQDDMIRQYPVTVSEESVSLTSLMSGLSNWDEKDIPPFNDKTSVGLNSLIQYLMKRYSDFTDQLKSNEISEEFLAYVEQLGSDAVSSLKYDYAIDPSNNLFTDYTRDHKNPDADKFMTSLNGLTHMYASELQSVEGFSTFSSYISLFSSFLNQLPDSTDFIKSQYDLIAGQSYATNANELILVVDEDTTITDLLYGQLGFYDETEFLKIAQKSIQDNDKNIKDEDKIDYTGTYRTSFTFDEIRNKKYYYYPDVYEWGRKEYKSVKFVAKLNFESSFIQTIISMIAPDRNPQEFIDFQMAYNLVYKDDADILAGNLSGMNMTFERDPESATDPENGYVGTWIPKENIFEMLAKAYSSDSSSSFDPSAISMKYIIGTDGVQIKVEISGIDMGEIFVTSDFETGTRVYEGYMYDVNPEGKDYGEPMELSIVGILRKKKDVNFGSLSSGVYFNKAFTKKYMEDQVKNLVVSGPKGIEAHMNGNDSSNEYEAYLNYKYTYHYSGGASSKVTSDIALSLNADQTSSLSSMFSSSMPGFGMDNDMNKAYLRSLCGLATKTAEDGHTKEFKAVPKTVSIYPRSFKDKNKVTSHLDKWNSNATFDVTVNGVTKTLSPDNPVRSEITYNDPVQMIIDAINTLILIITVALISFTSLSLVVSCFMIAVITFISTMERIKEIGVIRSLGGRKKDVSRLFIAECLITGLASGVIGIVVTYILQLILNLSMLSLNVYNIAALPIWVALLMIVLSISLNVLSGLIPSMKASNQDPVVALRSE